MGQERIRAAIITEGDPLNVRHWSGTPLSIVGEAGKHFDLVHVERQPVSRPALFVLRAIKRLSRRKINLGLSTSFMRVATLRSRMRVRKSRPDVVIVISSSVFPPLCASKWPVVHVADATGPQMIAYNPEFASRPAIARAKVAKASIRGVRSCLLSTYPSSWACRSAVADCGADPDAVVEIAWGPNLDPAPLGHLRSLEPALPVRMLFVGIGWKYKGGALACEAVQMLRSRGVLAELDVVGCERPEEVPDRFFLRFHGLLDKRDQNAANRLRQLYDQAHIFVLPTQTEAYGVVFAEAAAYGLPIVSIATGGVPSVVQHGKTGILVPENSGAKELAQAIASLIDNPDRYRQMSQNALDDARDRLNWAKWGTEFERQVRLALDRR